MDEHIFLILTVDPWYVDIIIYLQTLKVPSHLSRYEYQCLCHNSKSYLIIGDTLYRHGVVSILHPCLTHDEDEVVLNDCHSGVCGGHLSRLATPKKFLK